MNELCEDLRIDFDEKLLTPTSIGKLWEGNSVTNRKFKSISRERLHFDNKQLTAIEIVLVNKHIGPVLNDFKYEHLSPNGTVYAVNKNESLRTYLRNRCLLKRQFIF